jgi:pSer/pThr/pTyr-binding forkhead associated (FHA) protein
VTIGRRATNDIPLPWDGDVSRVHAELACIGGDWIVCDEGMSHNGTFVNGERVRGRRRLVRAVLT